MRVWDLTGWRAGEPAPSEPLTLRGHEYSVWSVVFSPDGHLLASGSYDKTVRVWDLTRWRAGGPAPAQPLTLRGHEGWVWRVAFSPDGHLLASGSADTTVRVWDLTGWRAGEPAPSKPLTLRGHGNWVYSVAFSPDGNLLASGSDDTTVRVWGFLLLADLARESVEQATRQDLALAQSALRDGQLPERERHALEFIAALLRWKMRFDIEIEDASSDRTAPGEFDIDIAE